MVLLGGRTEKLLTLDWDTHALRIVDARVKRDNVRVVKALSVPWTRNVDLRSPQELGAFIRRVLDQQRIRTTKAVVDIPRDQAVLHTLTLPSSSRDELPGMVHFQIVRELPFSLDEAVVDFVMPQEEDEAGGGQTKVLVAACRNEVLAFYQSAIESAGLTLERIGLRPHANLMALPHSSVDVGAGRTLFIDVGPGLTEIDIVRQGQLAFSRAASVAVPMISDVPGQPADETARNSDDATRQRAVSALLVEVTRTIEAYRTIDHGASIGHAVIAGSCGIEPDLPAALEQRFGFSASLYTPSEKLDLPADQREGLTGFSAVLGLAVAVAAERLHYFDFLHPKRPEDVERARRRKIPLVAAALVLYLGATGVAYWQWVAPTRREIENLEGKIAARKQWTEDFEDFQEQLDVASAWARQEVIWLDELDQIIQALPAPEDAYLDSITMQEDGQILLDVRFTSVGAKNIMVTQLRDLTVGPDPETARARYEIEEGEFVSSSDPKYKFRGRITLTLTGGESMPGSSKRS